jgi:peptide/nickel transport system ATP-binding protein
MDTIPGGLTAQHAGAGAPPEPLLSLRHLAIALRAGGRALTITQDVSLAIARGERVGLVGESGCGKTITGLAILGLLPEIAPLPQGEIWFEGRDLLTLSEADMRQVRGRRIGMIFQEPMSALDPVFTIGEQISETARTHLGLGRRAARARAIERLAAVGIPAPERRYDAYPHQLSGGMRQRAMIAIALICEPALLIADEPTTALDVTVQAQIVELLVDLSERTGSALLLISHDVGVVAEACTRVVTMYAGQIVEDAPVDHLLTRPRHPYSSALLRSLPRYSPCGSRLPSIPGRVPSADAMPSGCRFASRCTHAEPACAEPQLLRHLADSAVRCQRYAELTLPGTVP